MGLETMERAGSKGDRAATDKSTNLGAHGSNHVLLTNAVFVKLMNLNELVDLGRFELPTPWLQSIYQITCLHLPPFVRAFQLLLSH